ncbi:uncharacterized protein LOC111083959, partial [Limulus polyphemus]|uniref:Uncharacterized protein LOC111083959 n=1 Tax=Limulus polyphemus TaxID=6850 RepID=A0ABM1RYH0_LIMPO
EKCDSFTFCSSAKEEKLNCPTDETTLGQHLCHDFTDCHRYFTCCQSSASSKKICLPRMDFQINWTALEKQKNQMASVGRISKCHGAQSNLYWIAPKASSYESETEDHFDEKEPKDVDKMIKLAEQSMEAHGGSITGKSNNVQINLKPVMAAQKQFTKGYRRLIDRR